MSLKKILILDDDDGILAISRFILEEKGWDVATSSDCVNIIEKVKNAAPDIILMDNQIPDIGGIQATKLIKQEDDLKDIPVILFTAHNDIEKMAKEAGTNFFLSKPLDLQEFEDTLVKIAGLN
jgi:CheY-like chemotaxis protein